MGVAGLPNQDVGGPVCHLESTMHRHSGLTLVEMLISLALFGTLMSAVMASFVTGQRAFSMSETFIQAHQTARSAMDTVQQDLAQARIDGIGSFGLYVRFRRPAQAIVDAAGQPSWEPQRRMYVWCPSAFLTADPCQQIQPRLATPPPDVGRWGDGSQAEPLAGRVSGLDRTPHGRAASGLMETWCLELAP